MKELNNLTLTELLKYAQFGLDTELIYGITVDQYDMLVSCAVDIKGRDGKWYELTAGSNYHIKIAYEKILIVIEPFYCEADKLEEEYELTDGNVIIPKYTGYYKILNRKETE